MKYLQYVHQEQCLRITAASIIPEEMKIKVYELIKFTWISADVEPDKKDEMSAINT